MAEGVERLAPVLQTRALVRDGLQARIEYYMLEMGDNFSRIGQAGVGFAGE